MDKNKCPFLGRSFGLSKKMCKMMIVTIMLLNVKLFGKNCEHNF
jgi:hypothetical protein